MGPALFHLNEGLDVRPHPHIGLATVTYLFEGKIHHRDSLGSNQLIEPGAINWMTAGNGIVYSERTPNELRETGSNMSGIQCWVALPTEHEDTEPTFTHHPASTIPKFAVDGVEFKLLVGTAYGKTSPVKTFSELFYLEAIIPKGKTFSFPTNGQQSAAYLIEGNLLIDEQKIEPFTMAVAQNGEDLYFEATEKSKVILLGGMPVGERFIYWNFVSSSKDKIELAKVQWNKGHGPGTEKFKKIPGDDQEFIPLPAEPGSSKGTIM